MENQIHRITNFLIEKTVDAYVATNGQSEINLSRTVVFLADYATRYTDGAVQLSKKDIAKLLVEFYDFHESEGSENAKELDISMVLKDYAFISRIYLSGCTLLQRSN